VATAIRLHQRLDSQHRYRRIRAHYSRNGSPVAHPHATRFYLLGRLNDELTGDDVIAFKEVLKSKYASQTVFSTFML